VDAEEFRAHGHRLIDWIIDYHASLGALPVQARVAPGETAAKLPEHPGEPDGFDALLADLDDVVVPGLTNWQHPGFFAWFPANTGYPAILAELVSAGLGVQGMNWASSPAVTEVETRMMDWMAELLALPGAYLSTSARGGGVIQGSASEATLTSVLAARYRATGGAVNTDSDTTKLVAYATSQAHSSIEKGLRIAGIGTGHLRMVGHDENFAMRPDALAAAIAADRAAGLVPFWVCATVGTTNSLAIDPVRAVGEVARREGLWLHVDAAMAGIATLCPELRWLNDGLELADSYGTNPHKWMGVTFDCSLFYTADRASLLGALSILPEYLRTAAAESGAVIDYRDWQVPLGRRFRALKLWFTLRTDGVGPAQAMIRDHLAWTSELADWVAADDRFAILAPHPLNLLCLALKAGDDATTDLIGRANATGRVLFTRTVLGERVALRFSIGSRSTTLEDVRSAWRLLQELAG
jgi:aromatic-L-amino-acid/L-tryptophan decarboxylase